MIEGAPAHDRMDPRRQECRYMPCDRVVANDPGTTHRSLKTGLLAIFEQLPQPLDLLPGPHRGQFPALGVGILQDVAPLLRRLR
jgi:hypothetical protein